MITLTKQTIAEYIEKNPDAPFWQLNFKKIDDLMMIGDEYYFVCRSESPRGKAYWEQVYLDTDIYVDLTEPKRKSAQCFTCNGAGKLERGLNSVQTRCPDCYGVGKIFQ